MQAIDPWAAKNRTVDLVSNTTKRGLDPAMHVVVQRVPTFRRMYHTHQEVREVVEVVRIAMQDMQHPGCSGTDGLQSEVPLEQQPWGTEQKQHGPVGLLLYSMAMLGVRATPRGPSRGKVSMTSPC